MKKTLVLAGCMLALMVTMASAAGINLRWNDCGAAGAPTNAFDCQTNSGTPFPMIASFLPPAGISKFLGVAAQIDITSSGALPDWWKHGTTACRLNAGMSVSFDFTSGPFSCNDVFGGQAAGGFAYDIGFGSPNRARLRVQAAIPAGTEVPLSAATEYYAFKVNLARSKSASPGNCVGCTEPMCIVLNDIQLFQPLSLGNDPDISNPGPSGNFVTWQAPTVSGCPQSTPTRNSSWGQVKSLYR